MGQKEVVAVLESIEQYIELTLLGLYCAFILAAAFATLGKGNPRQ